MLSFYKKIILSLFIMALLPSVFYASNEPGGGDFPEYVEREQMPEPSGQRVNIISYPEPTEEERLYLIRLSKPKPLTFQFAIGRGEQEMMEFGVRFSCYFRETAEKFNFGLIFSTYYIYTYLLYAQGKQHYIAFNTMVAFNIYGAHLGVGLDYNIKFKGPDSDEIYLNTIFYKKSYFSLDFEIGYQYMPKNNRFTFLVAGVFKRQLNGGAFEYQFPEHNHSKGVMVLLRVQIGLFLF